MTTVLDGRLMKLRAARTLWGEGRDLTQVIAFLQKINDDAILSDLLPLLTQKYTFSIKIDQCPIQIRSITQQSWE